jgi:hypothetical protein
MSKVMMMARFYLGYYLGSFVAVLALAGGMLLFSPIGHYTRIGHLGKVLFGKNRFCFVQL